MKVNKKGIFLGVFLSLAMCSYSFAETLEMHWVKKSLSREMEDVPKKISIYLGDRDNLFNPLKIDKGYALGNCSTDEWLFFYDCEEKQIIRIKKNFIHYTYEKELKGENE